MIWSLSFFALLTLLPPGMGQECSTGGICDSHERCPVWAEEGECIRSKAYMAKHCPVSCKAIKEERNTQQECMDAHPRCPAWAELGECPENVDMRRYCAKSCNTCVSAQGLKEDEVCLNKHENCQFWADKGECQVNPTYMLEHCQKSCGSCKIQQPRKKPSKPERELDATSVLSLSEKFGTRQKAEGADSKLTLEVVASTIEYMATDKVKNLPTAIRENCQNKHEFCSFWAVIGECEKNKSYMKINCAPSCKTCDLIDMETRCPPLKDAVPALKPGEMNKMFERIIATAPGNKTLTDEERRHLSEDGMTEYTVNVLSSPGEGSTKQIGLVYDQSLPPWVIVFDNFITPEECDELVKLGHQAGYKRSEDVGEQKLDGTVGSKQSTGRTSENAWCSSRNGCRAKEVPTVVHNRMSKVMDIPVGNSEDLQILRYEVGQFYNSHHDYIPNQKHRQCGPRILTFFFYLTDVEAGGGTDFPDLELTVTPKKGRAVLWPSVYDSDPMSDDPRTKHQALPVVAGTKFAANGWIHLFDYVGPQEIGCN